MRQQDTAPLALAPPEPEQFKQLRRQHRVTVLAALALLDADQHALAVDVVGSEVCDLRHPQSGAVRDAQRGAVLDARCRLEQPPYLLDAQHVGQLAGTRREDQPARQVGPVKRHAKQEPQRRYRGADDGLSDTVLALLKLEAPYVLGSRGLRRASQERREGANVADIVVLGTRPH